MNIHWIKRQLVAIWCKIKKLEENGGGGTGEIPDHNELQGLQGGGPNEYYHLTEDEYNNLGEIPTLDEVLTSGNTATQDIVLQGDGDIIEIKSGVNDTSFYMDEDSIVGMKSTDGTTQTWVQVNPNNISINSTDPDSGGIVGNQYYGNSPNFGDNNFVQKLYVDNLNLNEITSNGNVTEVGIQFSSSGQINASSESFIFNTTPTNLGTKNVIIGQSAGMNMGATGHRNVIIGTAAGQGVTTGWNNTIIGNSAAPFMTTGYDNVAIGRGAASGLATAGSRNVVIGNGISQANNQIQTGNVVIGNFLGLSSGDVINNKLAIHANPNYTATTGSPNGYGTAVSYTNALIYGDFSERWVKFNGSVLINPTHIPTADATYTKQIVAKADGTLGWTDSTSISANKQRFTGDTTSAKTLTQTPKVNSVAVILNGLELDEQGGDYTVSGTTVTLANEPLITDVIVIKYLY